MKHFIIRKTRFLFWIALAGTIGLGACGGAPSDPGFSRPDTAYHADGAAISSSFQSDDEQLVAELVQSLDGSLAILRQAEQKSGLKAAADLAKQLDTEHTLLANELTALAAQKGWSVLSKPSEEDDKKAADLMKESSPGYERDWLATLKDRQEMNLKKLEAHQVGDADLKAVFDKVVPKLRELLRRIEAVQREMR